MIYITGDCHGEYEKLSPEHFPQQRDMTRDDIVIVCGDFGVWHDDAEERAKWDALEKLPFTIAFCDGNHENFDRLYSDEFPVVDFRGGRAHKLCENVFHLMRGHIFDFDGKSFFAFGGAPSHDIWDGVLDRDDYGSDEEFAAEFYCWQSMNKVFRINHVTWWKQEIPSPEEMEFGRSTLAAHGNKVDYIVSHACPARIAAMHGFNESNALGEYFDELADTVTFDKWFFGHYHHDRATEGEFEMLFREIRRIV